MPPQPMVLKLGGELLEQPGDLSRVARGIARLASRIPLVVVHGGGREIDAAMGAKGLSKVQVDGIRVTTEATLDVRSGRAGRRHQHATGGGGQARGWTAGRLDRC